ncbi:hypothetical protein OG251_32075 [Streptomyces sp. NBC_01237]|nr:hypothetical protein OG251_32075 [Streptomyces sp. NBC_01237]
MQPRVSTAWKTAYAMTAAIEPVRFSRNWPMIGVVPPSRVPQSW